MCWMCDHPGSTVDDYLAVVRAIIFEHGWAVQFVEDDRMPYANTIGLTDRGLPELLVTGLSPQRAARLLNRVAQRAVDGDPPSAGMQLTVCAGPLVEIIEVEHPDPHMNFGLVFYGNELRALQLVWSDARGRWPWTRTFNDGRGGQSVLGVREERAS